MNVMDFTSEDPIGAHERYEFIRWVSADSQTVFVARDLQTQQTVAVKIFPRGYSVTEGVRREVLHHSRLHHENVIAFLDAFLTDRYLCIVLELGEQNLWQFVHSRAGCLDEKTAQYIFLQLLNGVQYCHSQGIVNRDIKLENCLIKTLYKAGKPYPVLKICDFGYCKHVEKDSIPKSLVGTAAYLCKDIVESTGVGYRGELVDVWTCGISLYFLLEGRFPFGTESLNGGFMELVEKIKHLQYDPCERASETAQDLLYQIICPQELRLDLAGVLDHWWVRQAVNREDTKEMKALANTLRRTPSTIMDPSKLEDLIQEAAVPISIPSEEFDDPYSY